MKETTGKLERKVREDRFLTMYPDQSGPRCLSSREASMSFARSSTVDMAEPKIPSMPHMAGRQAGKVEEGGECGGLA